MKYQVIIPVALGIVFLIWYIREKIKAYSMKALYIKIAASACFIATALCGVVFNTFANGLNSSLLYGILIIGGLVCGLLGDVVLDLKYIDRERENLHTNSGFIFFGAGHILFMLALFFRYGLSIDLPFLSKASAALLSVIWSLIIGFAAGYLTTKSASRWGNNYGSFFTIIAIYSSVLASAAAMSAIYTIINIFSPASRVASAPLPAAASSEVLPAVPAASGLPFSPACILMLAGLVFFMISDLILSRTYFGRDHHKPADIISNYVFYYAAQFLIALSVLL